MVDISALKENCVLVVCRRSVVCLDMRQGDQVWTSEPYRWQESAPIDDSDLFEKHCWIHDAALDAAKQHLWCSFGQHALPMNAVTGEWLQHRARRVWHDTRGLDEDQTSVDVMHFMLRDVFDDITQFAQDEPNDDDTEVARFRIAPKETFGAHILFIPAQDDIPDSQDTVVVAGNLRGLFAAHASTGKHAWVHYPFWKCSTADILADREAAFQSSVVPYSSKPVVSMQYCTVSNGPGADMPRERCLVLIRSNWNAYCISVDTGVERWRVSISAALGQPSFEDDATFGFTEIKWVSNQPPAAPKTLHISPERDLVTVVTPDGRMVFWRLGSGEHVASFTGGLFSGPQLGPESLHVDHPAGTQLSLWESALPDELDILQPSWNTDKPKVKRPAIFTLGIKHEYGDAMTKLTVLTEPGAGGDAELFPIVPHISTAPEPWTKQPHQAERLVADGLHGCGLFIAVDGFYRARSSTRSLVLTEQIVIGHMRTLLMVASDGVMTLWRLPEDKAPGKNAALNDPSHDDGGAAAAAPTELPATTSSAVPAVKASILWRRTFKHYAPFKSQYCNPNYMRSIDRTYVSEHNSPSGQQTGAAVASNSDGDGKAVPSSSGTNALPGSAGSTPPERSERELRPQVEDNRFGQRISRACLVQEGKQLFTISSGERHHTMRLWDVITGELLKVFSSPQSAQLISNLRILTIPDEPSLVLFASHDTGNRTLMLHMVRGSDLNTMLWLPIAPSNAVSVETDLQHAMLYIPGFGYISNVLASFEPRRYMLRDDIPVSEQVGGGQSALDAWKGDIEHMSRDDIAKFGRTPVTVGFSFVLRETAVCAAEADLRTPSLPYSMREQHMDGDLSHSMPVALPMKHVENIAFLDATAGTLPYIAGRFMSQGEPMSLCPSYPSAESWVAAVYAVGTRALLMTNCALGVFYNSYTSFDLAKAAFRDESPRPFLAFTWASVQVTSKSPKNLFVVTPVLRQGQASPTSSLITLLECETCPGCSDKPRFVYKMSTEVPSLVNSLFFSEETDVIAGVVPGEGIWLLDGRTMQPIKSFIYPFEGSVDTIELVDSSKPATILDADVADHHRKRMYILGTDGQVRDVILAEFFGRMSMARVVDLVENEEAAATGQVDITGWLFYIRIISGLLLILLDFLQMVSFAFSAATPPSLDSTAESVKQFQALGTIGVDVNFKLVYWLCVGVLAAFFAVFGTSEMIEEYAFRRQENVVVQTIWTVVTVAVQLMTTVAVVPLVRVLSGAFDCIPSSAEVEGLPWNAVSGQKCFEGDHFVFLVLSILLLGLYLPVVIRLLLVGNDLTRVELLLSAPWDWSQDDRSEPPREHVLSLASSRFGPAQALVKLFASIIYVLGGTRFTIGSSTLVLLLGVALMVVSFREPPYYNQTMNHVRSALDAGVVWTYLVAVAASIVLDGDATVESGSATDITLTVLPVLILVVLPVAFLVRRARLVEKCTKQDSKETTTRAPEPLEAVVVHGPEKENTKPSSRQQAADSVSENPIMTKDDTVTGDLPVVSGGAAGAAANSGGATGADTEQDVQHAEHMGSVYEVTEDDEADNDDDDAASLCSLTAEEREEMCKFLQHPFDYRATPILPQRTVSEMMSVLHLARPHYRVGKAAATYQDENLVEVTPEERQVCQWGRGYAAQLFKDQTSTIVHLDQ